MDSQTEGGAGSSDPRATRERARLLQEVFTERFGTPPTREAKKRPGPPGRPVIRVWDDPADIEQRRRVLLGEDTP